MTAVTLAPHPGKGWEIFGYNNLWCCYSVMVSRGNKRVGFGLLFGNHIVDASSLVYLFTTAWCERLLNPFTTGGVWCKLSAY